MSNIWFTSDTHFGHRAVARHRGYGEDIDTMDADLIEAWNAHVAPKDEVYLLGDVSFRRTADTVDILQQLHGRKYLVRGNHDRGMNGKVKSCFAWVKDLYILKTGGPVIMLCHYPMLTWDRSHYGSYMLHGHAHGKIPRQPGILRADVGIDAVPDRRPASLDEVHTWMTPTPT